MANVVKKHSISHELAQKMVNEAAPKATHQAAPTQFVEANGNPLRLSPLGQGRRRAARL
jgi:hypothetical protein